MAFMQQSMRFALFACATLTLSSVDHPARAADASAWVEDLRSAVRLIAGAPAADAIRAGIEIKLQPGWHTYWRYPGDSGVPPRFNFAGSDNVAKATVKFPAPRAFTDEAGTILGYTGDVILPVDVTPKAPGKPVTLRMKIDYAVCEKLCVPVEATTELRLGGSKGREAARIAAADARVPKALTAAQAGLKVNRITGKGAKPGVLVDVPAAAGGDLHVFAEGPTGEWALPVPRPAQGAPAGRAYFAFNLDGLPPGTDPTKPLDLTFTVVRGDKAAEVRTHLD